MPTEFERALQKVLVHEGGFSNHPRDPGGATMKGVTQRVYDDYRKSIGKSVQSVKLISPEEITAIYRRRYWDVIRGDELPAGVGYAVFDGAVNSGVGRAPKWLQRALAEAGLYSGPIDGVVGPGTLDAVNAHSDHDELISRMLELRLAFLKALKTWPTFGKGWAARVHNVELTARGLARGAAKVHAAQFVEGGDAKAFESDAKKAPSPAPGDAAASGGAITAALTQAREQLEPLSAVGNVSTILAWLAIAGLVVAVGGIAYRFYAKRKADRLKEALA